MKSTAHQRTTSGRDRGHVGRALPDRDHEAELNAGADVLQDVLHRTIDGGSARRLVDGLHPRIGNAATASLLADPAGRVRPSETTPVQRVDGEEDVDEETAEETELADPALATSSSTTINVVNTTYSVSGDFLSVANQLAARTEAGSVTSQFSDIAYTTRANGTVRYANITVTETISLPTWADRSKGSAAEQAEWDRFLAALTAHEQQHVAIDRAAYTNIHTRLINMTEADADAKIDEIETATTTANDEFDTNTDHGRNAGTAINANVASPSTPSAPSAPAPAPTP